jgi:hypothetical protein
MMIKRSSTVEHPFGTLKHRAGLHLMYPHELSHLQFFKIAD